MTKRTLAPALLIDACAPCQSLPKKIQAIFKRDYQEVKKLSQVEITNKIQELAKEKVVLNPALTTISSLISEPVQKVREVITAIINTLTQNLVTTQKIANTAMTSVEKVNEVLTALPKTIENADQPALTKMLAQQTNQSAETISRILTSTFAELSATSLTAIAEKTSLETDKINQVVSSVFAQTKGIVGEPAGNQLNQLVSRDVSLPVEKISQILSSYFREVVTNSELVEKIRVESQASLETVNQVLQTFGEKSNTALAESLTKDIASSASTTTQTVEKILQSLERVIESPTPAVNQLTERTAVSGQVSQEQVKKTVRQSLNLSQTPTLPVLVSRNTQLPVEKTNQILSSYFREVVTNSELVEKIRVESQASLETVNQVLQTFGEKSNTALAESLTKDIASSASTTTQTVEKILQSLERVIESPTPAVNQLTERTAVSGQVSQEQVKKTVGQAIKLGRETKDSAEKKAADKKNLYLTIAKPDKVSLDEYEEMKKMWIDHYTNGEVPLSEKIKTRLDWVTLDAVLLENLLNKLISENEVLRAEALKEIAEIIPFFILGNMDLQSIAVYLKAKKAAAEIVRTNLLKEEEIKKALFESSKQTDVFVDRKPAAATTKASAAAVAIPQPDNADHHQ
jgi:hypothetical protein